MFDYYSYFITRYARKILWALTGVTLLMGACALRLQTDNGIETWLLDDDPRRVSYAEFVKTFGTEEFVLVVFSDEDLFSQESLKRIHRLSENLKAADGVGRVWSISEIYREIASRLPPGGNLSLERFREYVVGHPLFTGNLVSDDGMTTAAVAVLTPDGAKDRRAVVRAIRRAATEACPGKKLYFAGPPVMSAELDRIAARDPRMFTPMVIVLVSVLLLALFRGTAGVRLPLAVAGMCIVWALGAFALMGGTMNLVLAVFPPLILVVAIGDSIHLLCRYQFHVRQNSPQAAVLQAVRDVWKPCLMTSLTTAVGFGSLALSKFSPVRSFGLLAMLGILSAFVITMTLVPASITYKRGKGLSAGSAVNNRTGSVLSFVSGVNAAHPGFVLLAFGLAGLAGLAGATRLNVEANTLKFFPADGEIRQTYAFIEEKLTGLSPFEILLRSEEMAGPPILAAIDRIEGYLEDQPYMTHSFSIRALQAGLNRDHWVPPPSEGLKIPAALSGLKSSLLSPDEKATHISGRGLTMNSILYDRAMGEIESFVRESLPEGVTAELTGVVPMITAMDRYLLITFVKSFTTALLVIGLVMSYNFRSLRLGLLSMVPNTVPILVTLGVMGFSGIDLSPATVTVAGISLGIAVDDTIHYMYRYFSLRQSGEDSSSASRLATATVGRPIMYTTFTLTAGFIVMVISDFGPTRHFGFLSALCIMLALLCDLFLLPVLLTVLKPAFHAKRARGSSGKIQSLEEFQDAL